MPPPRPTSPALILLVRGKGRIYFSATGFLARDLTELLDRVLDDAEVRRLVRIEGEEGKPICAGCSVIF